MLKIVRSSAEGYRELTPETCEAGVWLNLVNPTQEELDTVHALTDAPMDLLKAALDSEETSRIEVEDHHLLVITNIPKTREMNTYDTLPLGIVLSAQHIVTVCLEENEVLGDFNVRTRKAFCTFKRTRFLLQMLYKTATLYLKDLQQMNRKTDDIERDLRKSMKNQELFQLLDLQKGLTYFTSSLRSNRVVIEKLLRLSGNAQLHHLIKLREEDEDLFDDVKIEYDQAIEMVQMHWEILAGMMDAFASIISNNLNMVMKFLAAATIIISIPNLVASFFGMNVPVPLQGHPAGFLTVVAGAMGLAMASGWYLWKRRMF